MGEVGVEEDLQVATAEESKKKNKKNEEEDESLEAARWERFLPRMVLRVLLVEADDSTRQIIAALLRKCSYRVAAVPDGLMAWETLKDRPHNVDLILTEVELPSISGFSLLTLVMEHDICKNIPVIMMSSHDSISMVLKCMLKGAADFLIKPVRRNELRNLWQHVWRRHTVCSKLAGGRIPHNLRATEHKVEATAENKAESNQSSDYGSSTQKNKEGSDTQSSCTPPYLEAESTYIQTMQGLSQMKCTSANLSNTSGEQPGNAVKVNQESLQNEGQAEGISDQLFVSENSNRLVRVKEVACCTEACESNASKLEENSAFVKGMTRDDAVGLQSDRINVNVMIRVGCNDELAEPSTGAIDLIGLFDNRPKGTFVLSSLSDGANKFEFSPQLELSLRRSCLSSTKNHGASERPTLNHSDASAFSWYNNSKSLQSIFPTLDGNRAAFKEGDCKPSQHLESNNGTSQRHLLTLSDSQENLPTPVTGQTERTFPSSQLGLITVPGVKMDDMYAGCNNVFPNVYYAQSSLPPAWSPNPDGQRDYSSFPMSTSVHSNLDVHNSEQGYHRSDEATNCSIDQTVREQNKQEPVGELRCSSPIADQSACSSLCNGGADHEKSSAHGGVSSRSDASASATFAAESDKHTTMETFNDSNFFIHDGFKGMVSHRSTQREAALTKFRLKRKDRCFEKKVRYQSRKRLAEQRPRVKGQFVRQVQNDTPIGDADGPKI
ncbi:two-component response regulator-like PRR95 isoform X2 [Durio zibethinus]|uniref:Two-component response regulator-like PRR95 isoform X2 n=1 Tax=Durio zibethinus TaxID=66656 RepID=A0A6P5XZ44_DURZI|nr:two-component response regulator-like PRR95 isoform X2 [Durio zibethinus]